jgi:ribose transport system substrate-binding protein
MKSTRTLVCLGAIAAVLTAAGAATALAGRSAGAASGLVSGPDPAVNAEADTAIAKLIAKPIGKDSPNGQPPSPASSVDLTPAEVSAIRAKHATAAIVFFTQSDFATTQIEGMQAEFKRLGVTVVSSTNANGEIGQLITNVQSVLARKPTILVSSVVDNHATAQVFKSAIAQGTKVVFIETAPTGLEPGNGPGEYLGVVNSDNYALGEISGYLLAAALGGKGEVGMLPFRTNFFSSNERYLGAQAALAKFSGIKIVQKTALAGPDFAGEAQSDASAMLTKYPNLAGIWGFFDVPGEGVLAALRASNRGDVAIVTCDYGQNIAIALASGGPVKGVAAQRTYQLGIAEADMGALGVLGKKTPGFVELPVLAATKDNALEVWRQVWHTSPPPKLASAGG